MAGLSGRNNNTLQQWYNLFKSSNKIRSEHAENHWQHIMRLGLPTSNNEDWKHIPLDIFLSHNFVLQKSQKNLTTEIEKHVLLLNATLLVFVDGILKPELSSHDTEVFVVKYNDPFENCTLPKPIKPEIFLHLTECLSEKVTFIRLPRNKLSLRPLYLLHITSGQMNALNTVHYRHHLELEENSKAEVIEHYITLNSSAHFTGTRITFNVANNVLLNHVKIVVEDNNSYHFAHNDIVIGYNAKVTSTSFIFGSRLLRQNTSIQLNGENVNLSLNSLMLPMNSEVANIRSYLEHNEKCCLSRQLHKSVTHDKGLALFNGHIVVTQHAVRTNSQMINNNLLLGKQAEVYTKPQLEIYNDDVKCSHAATVGHIDKDQIFYLRSRGIDEHTANQMIIYAFTTEITEILENDILRQAILQNITERFLRINE